MKFQVVGSNRDTGARMVLELEAESKAAAERKATQSGMSVNHVRDMSSGHTSPTGVDYTNESRRPRKGMSATLMWVVFIVVVAAAIYFRKKIMFMFGH